MRAAMLASCALLALSWPLILQSRSVVAQDASVDKSGAAQAPAGTIGREPGRPVAPPPRAAETPDRNAGRVGSLSPDEERRAARGRERAATAAKAAQGQPERTQPERTQPEISRPEHVQADGRGITAVPHPVVTARRAIADKDGPALRKPRKPKDHVIRSARVEPMAPRRADGPIRRRRLAGDPGRAPRIGDVVPDDVPLSQLPPGARPDLIGGQRVAAAAGAPRGPWFYRPYLPAYLPYPVNSYPAPMLLVP